MWLISSKRLNIQLCISLKAQQACFYWAEKTNVTLWTSGSSFKVGTGKYHVWILKENGGVKWWAVPAKTDFSAWLLNIWHIQAKEKVRPEGG